MSLPTNKTMENYQTSSVMYDVNHFQDINHMHSKKFLLIHGTADGMYYYYLKCTSYITKVI